MEKMELKKKTIKEIISKKIEDNIKELNKWKELLFILVDESLDEKIEKLDSQKTFFETTYKEIDTVIKESKSGKQDVRLKNQFVRFLRNWTMNRTSQIARAKIPN